MERRLRVTRAGCLAVHLMPKYQGEDLDEAVDRICKHGPRNEHEREAVRLANADDCDDEPKIREDHEG